MSARLIEGQPFGTYADEPGLNWSTLKHATTSPRHYALAASGDLREADPRSMSGFKAQHAALLEPRTIHAPGGVRVWPGRRQGGAWDAALAADPDATWCTESELGLAQAVAAAVHAHPVAGPLLADAPGERVTREVSMYWVEADRRMKGRADWIRWSAHKRLVGDLKAVPSLKPRRMATWIARQLYHGQMAHYAAGVRAVEAALGLPAAPIEAWIVAYETTPCVDVGAFYLGTYDVDGAIYCGQMLRAEALDAVAAGEAAGLWPGQAPEPVEVHLPAWAFGDDEEEEA